MNVFKKAASAAAAVLVALSMVSCGNSSEGSTASPWASADASSSKTESKAETKTQKSTTTSKATTTKSEKTVTSKTEAVKSEDRVINGEWASWVDTSQGAYAVVLSGQDAVNNLNYRTPGSTEFFHPKFGEKFIDTQDILKNISTVMIYDVGTDPWSVQLLNTGLSIRKGRTYHIKFKYYSFVGTEDFTGTVLLQHNSGNYDNYLTDTFTYTSDFDPSKTDSNSYETYFTAEYDDDDVAFAFNFGDLPYELVGDDLTSEQKQDLEYLNEKYIGLTDPTAIDEEDYDKVLSITALKSYPVIIYNFEFTEL